MDERITVTIGDPATGPSGAGGPAGLDAVVQRLREAGMKVEQVLETLGVVTGSAPASHRSRIEAVPGVVSVEPEGSFRLPPPDSDVQ
jgi:hypothetical protein